MGYDWLLRYLTIYKLVYYVELIKRDGASAPSLFCNQSRIDGRMRKEKMPPLDCERRHYMFHVKRCLRFIALEATLLELTARGIDVSPA